ncbi:hypothetical protein JOF56_010025 [Kibdelosporangium banguiense]|uniref:CRISPR-associated DxTHG motif protein n=1 Tax=Kibdelosporangium banguiense TaxID=1365924 RepID=A0ABS4TZ24_9PSEU|nr:hypothetical protein [Kibdelosporangium banguiense]
MPQLQSDVSPFFSCTAHHSVRAIPYF